MNKIQNIQLYFINFHDRLSVCVCPTDLDTHNLMVTNLSGIDLELENKKLTIAIWEFNEYLNLNVFLFSLEICNYFHQLK